MIKLGSRVRDIYTGFTGTAVARTEWLYGCSRIGIEPTTLKDGLPIEAQWFDEQRVEIIQEDRPLNVTALSSAAAAPGGPQRDPARSADPTR